MQQSARGGSVRESIMELVLACLFEEEDDEAIIPLLIQRKPHHTMYKHRNAEGTFSNLISRYLVENETKFHAYFRLTRNQFDFVLPSIKADIKKAPTHWVKNPISPEEKLGISLRYLATGESFRSLAFGFRVSHSEISHIVKHVMTSICKRLGPVLLPPPDEQKIKQISKEFWEIWNFPNCAGAIDGKLIRILCPKKSGSLYFNYKNYFSTVMLAIVDAKYKFVAVDIGSYGKEGDSGIFSKSVMGKQIYGGKYCFSPDTELPGSQKRVPYVIIGDEAFRLHKNILKPYNRNQAKEDFAKAVFNFRLCRARRVSENAFGLLCQIFRVFFTPIAVIPGTADLIVQAAVILHNLIRNDIDGPRLGNANTIATNPENHVLPNMIPIPRTGGFANAEGFAIRDIFKDLFMAESKLDWQDRMVLRT